MRPKKSSPLTGAVPTAEAADEEVRLPRSSVLGGVPDEIERVPERHRLRVTEGASAGTTFALVGTTWTVGRSAAGSRAPEIDLGPVEVHQEVRSVSRRHAELLRTANGFTLTDYGSANGTHVDGRRLAPGQSTALTLGATISIGRVVLVLESERGTGR